MKLNKILIIGGTHGNEKTGVDVVHYFKSCKIKNIDTLIANPRAVNNNCRFIETDLNRSFNLQKKSYEERRAVFISKKMKQYDFIIEFHNTNSMTNCAIITNKRPTILQSKMIKYFGFKHVVVMPPKNSLSSQNPSKIISFEISTNKKEFSSIFFIQKILLIKNEINCYDFRSFMIYKYVGVKIYKNTLQKFSFKIKDFIDFYPIKKKNCKILGLQPNINIPFLVGGTSYGKDFGFCVAEVVI